MSIRCLRWVCLPGAPLRRSDVLTTPGWMVPTRSKTVVVFPDNGSAAGSHSSTCRQRQDFRRSISTTSVAIELDQPLVADPEVMRDLMEHDVPDLAA
jgi:adenine-specific DNA methylase